MKHVLICAATRTEANACRRGVRLAHGDVRFEILCTGIGQRRARRNLVAELTRRKTGKGRHSKPLPDLIVSSGFAGTFNVTVQAGSWVCSGRVLLWGNPKEHKTSVVRDGDVGTEVIHMLRSLPFVKPVEVTTLSAAHLVSYDVVMRESLREPLPIALDMESAALGAVASEYGLPFAVVRLVTDTPRVPLPPFVYSMAKGAIARGVFQIAKNPVSLARFLKSGLRWRKQLEAGWKTISS